MKNEKLTIDNNNFVRLSRSFQEFYLDKHISFEEFEVIVWLWFKANPKTGRIGASYEGLSKDFQERYSKNKMNKIMLELKRQKLIWYPRQQGRRSSFNVDIQSYPLSNKTYRDISGLFKKESGRSSDASQDALLAEAPAEVKPSWQKSESWVFPLNKPRIDSQEKELDRSYNNENEKEKKKNYRSVSNNRVAVDNFIPKNNEEYRCWQIAQELGEQDMRFMLSALKKYGLSAIERTYIEIKERPEGSIKNKGAYFNELIKRFGEE